MDYDDYKKKARWIWFFVLSVPWMMFMISEGNDAYTKAAAETAGKTGFSHFWSNGAGVFNSDADNARMSYIMGGVFGLIGVFFVAHIIAGVQVSMKQDAAKKNQEAQNQREQSEFQKQMQDMDEQSNQQDKLSKFAQSKQELIMRLGSIDQFVRVLETETDANSRTMALQDAHSQMTKLTASLASEQISREAFDDPVVREHAWETSKDLALIGLANDRLNRDLTRMFKLNGN
jgi:mannitol-specific phosphotransferase system IIBC component